MSIARDALGIQGRYFSLRPDQRFPYFNTTELLAAEMYGVDPDEWHEFSQRLSHVLMRIYLLDKENYDMHECEVVDHFTSLSQAAGDMTEKFLQMKSALESLRKQIADIELQQSMQAVWNSKYNPAYVINEEPTVADLL